MKKVYIVQFDWATPDASSVDLYVYDSYDKAYDKFKELICAERKSENSWVGDIGFVAETFVLWRLCNEKHERSYAHTYRYFLP